MTITKISPVITSEFQKRGKENEHESVFRHYILKSPNLAKTET